MSTSTSLRIGRERVQVRNTPQFKQGAGLPCEPSPERCEALSGRGPRFRLGSSHRLPPSLLLTDPPLGPVRTPLCTTRGTDGERPLLKGNLLPQRHCDRWLPASVSPSEIRVRASPQRKAGTQAQRGGVGGGAGGQPRPRTEGLSGSGRGTQRAGPQRGGLARGGGG